MNIKENFIHIVPMYFEYEEPPCPYKYYPEPPRVPDAKEDVVIVTLEEEV